MLKKITATRIHTAIKRSKGQTVTEYALIISLVAIGALVAFAGLSVGSQGLFTRIVDSVRGVLP